MVKNNEQSLQNHIIVFCRRPIIWSKVTIFIPNLNIQVQRLLDWAITPRVFLFHFSQWQVYFWISIKTVSCQALMAHIFNPSPQETEACRSLWVCSFGALQSEFQYCKNSFTYLLSKNKTQQLEIFNIVCSPTFPKPVSKREAELWVRDLTYKQNVIH